MKHERILTVLTAWLLAFFTAWGTVGCFLSAFSLPAENSLILPLVCGISALLCACLLSIRQGGTVLLCISALLAGYLYHDGTAAGQLLQLLQHLSTIYNRAYGWGVLDLVESLDNPLACDLPLGIWACLITLTVSRSICRQKSVWLPVLTILLPLCSCIVVTDTVPGELWLFLVMAGVILLILTTSVRREQAMQGIRLIGMAVLPVLLALASLFLAVPQDDYVNQAELLRENLITAAAHLPQLMESGMNELASGLRAHPPKQVDLANLGPRIPFTYPVLEVTTEKGGALYLRGQDYDQYDGLGWTASPNRSEFFPSAVGETEMVTLSLRNRKEIRYLPYYPGTKTQLTAGFLNNDGQESDYSFARTHLPDNWRQVAYSGSTSVPEELLPYCALPEASRQGGAALLEGRWPEGASCTEKADVIAALVTDCAQYDQNSNPMPAGCPDFALWFLQEGNRGYCVHFATAAAVLLRAAGVPARYVTGYMVDTTAGETITVTEENAHAWAEYYEPNLSLWIPLEATPSLEAPVQIRPQRPTVQPQLPTTPEETTAPATEAATETSLPMESTGPQSEAVPTEAPPVPDAADRMPLLPLLFLPLIVLFSALQRSVRLALRRRLQQTGEPNRQALHRWQEAEHLARLLKECPPPELQELAQKAKFSQYELTEEELMQFDSFSRSCLRRLKEKPVYRQLIYRYVYAIY